METRDIAQKPCNRGMLLAEKHPSKNTPYLHYSYTKYVVVCWVAECPILPGSINFVEGGVWQKVPFPQFLPSGSVLRGFPETPLPPGSSWGPHAHTPPVALTPVGRSKQTATAVTPGSSAFPEMKAPAPTLFSSWLFLLVCKFTTLSVSHVPYAHPLFLLCHWPDFPTLPGCKALCHHPWPQHCGWPWQKFKQDLHQPPSVLPVSA